MYGIKFLSAVRSFVLVVMMQRSLPVRPLDETLLTITCASVDSLQALIILPGIFNCLLQMNEMVEYI